MVFMVFVDMLLVNLKKKGRKKKKKNALLHIYPCYISQNIDYVIKWTEC